MINSLKTKKGQEISKLQFNNFRVYYLHYQYKIIDIMILL